MKRLSKLAALFASSALALSACSSDEDGPAGGNDGKDGGAISVTASFYPLEYAASYIGGDNVTVSSLTPPGSDAHNLELSPRQVTSMKETDLVLYLSNFQAAMDDAVAEVKPEHVIDAADYANLEGEHTHDHGDHDHEGEDHAHEDEAEGDDHDHAHDHEAEGDDHDHAHEGEEHDHEGEDHDHEGEDHDHEGEDHDHEGEDHEGHGHDHSGPDPHFWLDPTRMAALADPIAEELSAIDPDNADVYAENAEKFKEEMAGLDEMYHDGLAQCSTKTFLVTHEAFGYIANSYDLDQQAIAGIETDTEPSPARVAEIVDMIEELDVDKIFATSEAEASIAQTIAEEADLEVGVLDALATQVDPEQDYHDVMTKNLSELQDALGCQ